MNKDLREDKNLPKELTNLDQVVGKMSKKLIEY